jgi:sugar lactone lactonase YvrE
LFVGALVAAAICSLSTVAEQRQTPEQQALANAEAMRAMRATLARITELQRERPDDAMLQYYRALFHARVGDREDALTWLRKVADRRLGFHPTAGSGFDSLADDPRYRKILADIVASEPKVTGAPVAFRLPDARFLPEGIAYDPKGARFFIGSVAERRILERTKSGKYREFSTAEDGLKSVLGLRVDAARNLLYAVSTNAFARAPDEMPENALFVYDLATRRLRDRYVAVEAESFNDVAVSADGRVAVTDSGTGAVYRLDPQMHDLLLIVPPGGFPSANGIDFAADGRHLFVAHATGIGLVDLEGETLARLPQPDDVVAGAIDGLYLHGDDLIGVQNVICPGRVLSLHLDATGRRITGMTVLQAYHPSLDEPTTGTIIGNDVYVIANSSVERMQADGTLRDAATLKPAAIIKVPLVRRAADGH